MKYLLPLLALLLVPSVLAASITGIVYDLSLKPMTTAVVGVDTPLHQRMVTYKDGSYAFKVPAGTYLLTANATVDNVMMYAQEHITVPEDGEYKIDLILAPVLSDDALNGSAAAPVVTPPSSGVPWAGLLIGLLFAVLLAGGGYLYWRRRHAPEAVKEKDEFRSAVIRALKTSNGRATQKDIRRSVPFSEAKVSLVLTELEDEGVVKKVKKGRGNVIVLK